MMKKKVWDKKDEEKGLLLLTAKTMRTRMEIETMMKSILKEFGRRNVCHRNQDDEQKQELVNHE